MRESDKPYVRITEKTEYNVESQMRPLIQDEARWKMGEKQLNPVFIIRQELYTTFIEETRKMK